MNKLPILYILSLILLIGFASAVSVESVTVDTVSPGEEGTIRIEIENNGNDDLEFLSFRLNFDNSGIIPIGSSEESLNTLEEDDEETLVFRFKIANTLPAGTYSVDYEINYEENGDEVKQSGTLGIVVSAEPEIEIVANTQNSIIGQQGNLDIRVINKGLADARFVSLVVESEDIIFISENSEYIGTIDSDDFETTSFDAIYNSKFPSITVKLTYKDFNNEEQQVIETKSLRVYSSEEAIEKGILKKNNASTYVGIVLLLLVAWIAYRKIKRRNKKKE